MLCRAGVKPHTLVVRPEGIPPCLRQLDQWICWRWVWRPDDKGGGRWTKIPIDCSALSGLSAASVIVV
jgi:hypothetical protein